MTVESEPKIKIEVTVTMGEDDVPDKKSPWRKIIEEDAAYRGTSPTQTEKVQDDFYNQLEEWSAASDDAGWRD